MDRGPSLLAMAKQHGWPFVFHPADRHSRPGLYVARQQFYSSGDDFGYYLGLVGALMMLSLLLFPLRKRIRFMQNWGRLPNWFRIHMMLGITGPLLILFHSNFRLDRSMPVLPYSACC